LPTPKANPGKVNYGFVPGTVGHTTAEMFARSAGIELTRIPYKGNGQAIGDLIGGHLSMMVLSLSPTRQRQGRQAVRARGDDARPLQAFA
jgi:tripartite-type tricarboxylate transporter receptor subunit TctC